MTTRPQGRVPAPLADAVRVLHDNPSEAESRVSEFLRSSPDHPAGRLVLATALRIQGKASDALAIVEALSHEQPNVPGPQYELGMALAALGRADEAVASLRRAVELAPAFPGAWRALGDLHFVAGDVGAAEDAYRRHLNGPVYEPPIHEALEAVRTGNLAQAATALDRHLSRYPTDVMALRMHAQVSQRAGDLDAAQEFFARCLGRMPGFVEARSEYAHILHTQRNATETAKQAAILLVHDPRNVEYQLLKASAFWQLAEYEGAIGCYRDVLKDHPDEVTAWTSMGHALRVVGRRDEAITAYRKSIALRPQHGDAYWGLVNLKVFRFEPTEIEDIRAQLARADLSDRDRVPLQFALASALENETSYEEAFRHYAQANARWKAANPSQTEDNIVARSKHVFTPAFFAQRKGTGNPAPDPIFVVGLPRSGSTLVDQILASHSSVEGTMELFEIPTLAERLDKGGRYPESLSTQDAGRLKTLGDEYLTRTREYRKQNKPRFIDKMPDNFLHVGLIHLILPNARIIDVRRHPLDCCLSNFRQHFAGLRPFAYDLGDLGRYYRAYVELMARYDAVLPGRVHRIFYEELVANPEHEIRRLLQYCGLPFEESCLNFHENTRAILTPSSEQVRQPIFREGMGHWRNYEPWLAPLRQALGPVLDAYPAVPAL